MQQLRRELRDLGLSERAGVFERKGQAIAKAAVDGALLQLALVKRPARTPEWVSKTVKDHAQLRDFVAKHAADFKVPRKVVFVSEIPKGATGKLQRIGLAAKLGLAEAKA